MTNIVPGASAPPSLSPLQRLNVLPHISAMSGAPAVQFSH
jgi:hypothetical protein